MLTAVLFSAVLEGNTLLLRELGERMVASTGASQPRRCIAMIRHAHGAGSIRRADTIL